MDQHPIPQDVTGFQFKLIGAMTVKQFGYVAVGVVMAAILYYLPLTGVFGILAKIMFIPLLGAGGVIIAFVPIDGRPIDVMTSNFVKALFSPNQYVYKRQGRKMSFSKISVATVATTTAQKTAAANTVNRKSSSNLDQKEEKLRAFLLSSQGTVKNDLDKKEASFIKSFGPVPKPAAPLTQAPSMMTTPVAKQQTPLAAAPSPLMTVAPAPMAVASPTPAPIPASNETKESLAQKEAQLSQELLQAKQEEAKPHAPAEQTAAHQKVETLGKQIDSIHSQKLQLEQELAKLQVQLSQQKAPQAPQPAAATVPQPQPTTPTVPVQSPTLVKVVPNAPVAKGADIPRVSDTPNVVVGIVKDPRGNVLSNILVEVKDKSGNPVRAFKTNPLGQFASATPLSPGVYTIELEDPKKQQNFDRIEITANNEIMRPIEVVSHDAREALRQQLFAN